MKLNPKLPQYFEKLKNDFQAFSANPNPEKLETIKGDLKQITNEINNLKL